MPPEMLQTLLMLVLIFVVFYFLLIRPAQKKQKDQQQMVSALAAGSRVMTTSGVFGTIVHLGERQAVLEIAPGIEMTVLKQAIMRSVSPAEEEFEYEDDASAAETDPADEGAQPSVDVPPAPDASPDTPFQRPDDAR